MAQRATGQRQRVALSLALVLRPSLIILDEPTTALDVVVEREIIKRLLVLQEELGFAMLFITHDLSLLLEFATRIGVLYSGRLVEDGPIDVFRRGGRHPYTKRLLASILACPSLICIAIIIVTAVISHSISSSSTPSECAALLEMSFFSRWILLLICLTPSEAEDS